MPEQVQVAVTGLGFAYSMLADYIASPHTKLMLLHDVDEARAKKISAEFGGVPYTLDFNDVLKSSAHFVEIGTPNQLHREQADAVFAAGKHALIEKPLAPIVDDCRAICASAQKYKKLLGLNMTTLNVPLYTSLKALVASGKLGKIAAVRIRNAHRGPYKSDASKTWRAKKANIGGGSFMQLTIHYMNLALWMLGDEVERVCAFSKNLYCQHSIEGDDATSATAELKSGALMTMESGYSSVGNYIAVYGTDGHFAFTDGQLALEANAPFQDNILTYPYPTPGKQAGEMVHYPANAFEGRYPTGSDSLQHIKFAKAVQAQTAYEMNGEIGLRDVAIIQALYHAAEIGRTVAVKEYL